MIKLKRAYDRACRDDSVRHLVERLWPQGIKKTRLQLDGWLKEVAPAPSCGNGSVMIRRSGRSFGSGTSPSSKRTKSRSSPY
jgi:hypothetical protein